MSGASRARVGIYLANGSLAHDKVVDPGLINNAVIGYVAPTITGGSISFTVRAGVRWKTHAFYGSDNLVVSGRPRTPILVAVKGGGGGGSHRYGWGEAGGNGGSGGSEFSLASSGKISVGEKIPASGNNSITVGGGGSLGEGSGAAGGASSALGLTGGGGAGGNWPYSPGAAGSGSGGGGWGFFDDVGGGGGGGAGSGWGHDWAGPSTTPGGAGQVWIRYRA